METLLGVLRSEFSDLPNLHEAGRIVIRLLTAGLLGGLIGFERERSGKTAGLRTQVLVAVSTALLVLIPQLAHMEADALSRVIQGILTGIGFIGAGTILKHTEESRVEGLTTSASIWFTASVGIAAGLGREASAVVGALLGVSILWLLPHAKNSKARAPRPKKLIVSSSDPGPKKAAS
jgi:putative Mg2+ transporter-C (MgtC) family protein